MSRLFSIFKKYKNLKLFALYKNILKNNNVFKIDEIKEKIYKEKLIDNDFYRKIFFLKNFDIDLSFRQYIYSNLIYIRPNIGFIKSLNNKKNIFTVHPKHLKILVEKNIPVNLYLSFLSWFIYSFKSLVNSQIYFFKIIAIFFINKRKIDKESAFFYSFPINKLEINDAQNEFFLNHFIKKFKLNKVYHDNKNLNKDLNYGKTKIIQNLDNIKLYSFSNLIKFTLFNFIFLLLSSILFFFKQDLAVMMKEILKSYLFHIEKKNYCKIYLFNNSDGIYRPMWSYLKKDNLKVHFFFFGGNCMPFNDDNLTDIKKFKLFFSSSYYGLKYWSWENYFFWNIFQQVSYQKNLINKNISYTSDRYVEINYKKFIKNSDKRIISFFDITPYDKIFAIKRFASIYHNFKNLNVMFKDILEVCNKLDINIIYKSKRFRKNIHDQKYIKFLEKINKLKNVSIYDEDYSSSSILENSNLAICSPFTSVGIIANSLNIKAAYYDLSDIYYKEKIAFGNLPIIKNKYNLEEWIKNNINNNEK